MKKWTKEEVKQNKHAYYLANREKILLGRKRYKAMKKYPGELSISTIQMVYEDNIKKHGTLTCYLCLKPIMFGQDDLEHRIPEIYGGTNGYDNLAVSCHSCNSKKKRKTEAQYRKVV